MPHVRHGSTVLAALIAIPLAACGAPKTPIHLATATIASASVSASATVTPPRPPCEIAADQRARVPKLLEAGKLDRTVRVIEHADALCPATAPTTWAVLVATLIELGRFDDANKLVVQIEASGLANVEAQNAAKKAKEFISQHKSEVFSEDAKAAAGKAYQEGMDAELAKNLTAARAAFVRSWSLYRPNGQALFAAGLVATALGQPAEAQRLLDRSVVELEEREGKKVVLDTPNGLSTIMDVSLQKNVAPGKAAMLAVAAGHEIAIIDTITWRERMRLVGDGRITKVAFSPSGKLIASGGLSGYIHIWDAATGTELRKLDAHTEWVTSLAFSPDGALLASNVGEKSIRVYDAHTGVEMCRVAGRSPIVFVDGTTKYLATNSADNTIRLWDSHSGLEHPRFSGRHIHADSVVSLASSPDGRLLLSREHGRLHAWDVTTGLPKYPSLVLDSDTETAVAVSPNGDVFAVKRSRFISIIDTSTGLELRRITTDHFDTVPLLAHGVIWPDTLSFSSDGSLVVASNYRSIRVYDIKTGVQSTIIREHTASIRGVVLSTDGKLIGVTEGHDSGQKGLVWSTSSTEMRQFEGRIATFSPDSKSVALDRHDGVHIWDIARRWTRRLPQLASSVAFSPDGTVVGLAIDGSMSLDSDVVGTTWELSNRRGSKRAHHQIQLWDVASSSVQHSLGLVCPTGDCDEMHLGPIMFSPDGQYVTAAPNFHADRSLRFWEVGSGKVRNVLLGAKTCGPLTFSPDGRLIALVDDIVEIWDSSSGTKIAKLQHDSVHSLAFSLDGRLLTSVSRNKAVVWDVSSYVELRRMGGHEGSVRFSPNGLYFVEEDPKQLSLRFWSTQGNPLLAVRVVDNRLPGWKDKLASYAFTTSPYPLIEFLGPDADSAREFPVCRVGPRTFPFALCRERVEVPRLFAKVLAGDMSYLDP